MSYPMAFAWAVGVTILLKLVLTATALIRPAAPTDIVNLGASEALAFLVGIFAVTRLHFPEGPLRDAMGLRRTHPGLPVLGLALGLAVHFPAESVRLVVERFYPTPPEVLAARLELLRGETLVDSVLILLVVACIGPLVEELFFRGALFTALRRTHNLLGAAVVTGVVFVVGHLDFRMWLPLAVVSAVLTHLRAVSGSLMPCLALHVGFNTVTVLAVSTGATSASAPIELAPEEIAAGWFVTLGLILWVQLISTNSEEAARARAEDAG